MTKEETRVGGLAATSEKYPSQAKTFDMFADWIDEDVDGRKGGHARWNTDKWVSKWEAFVHDTICEGYYIEQMAVNPQTVMIIKKYGPALYVRSRRQSVRQTDVQEINVAYLHNLDGPSEEDVTPPPSHA